MRIRAPLLLATILTLVVLTACTASNLFWFTKENAPDLLRQTVGLPSLAVGNLNPSARNPGLELLCTGLYDTPGGYCNYFALGVSFVNFTMAGNFTTGGK